MKRKILKVQKSPSLVKVVEVDRRGEYGVDRISERILEEIQPLVSPALYGILVQQLMAFHEDMQLEMADDLVLFARTHVAHFTKCPSADVILDDCYVWIAKEHGITKNVGL